MKPFDIELAKQGKPVCLRNGKKARIICFDMKNGDYPIVTLVEDGEYEVTMCVNERGQNRVHPSGYDLMMASEKKKGWINLYPKHSNDDSLARTGDYVFATERGAAKTAHHTCIATIPIEWEE